MGGLNLGLTGDEKDGRLIKSSLLILLLLLSSEYLEMLST